MKQRTFNLCPVSNPISKRSASALRPKEAEYAETIFLDSAKRSRRRWSAAAALFGAVVPQGAWAQDHVYDPPVTDLMIGREAESEPMAHLLGRAYNSFNGDYLASCLTSNNSFGQALIRIPEYSTDVKFTAYETQSSWKASILRDYSLSGSASILMTDVSANLQSKSSSSHEGSKSSHHAIGSLSYHEAKLWDMTSQSGELTARARQLLENGRFAAFRDLCGHGIIGSLTKGARLRAEFTATKDRDATASQTELLGALGVKFGMASLSASAKTVEKAENTLRQFAVDVSCFSRGSSPAACGVFTRPGGISDAVNAISKNLEEHPARRAITRVGLVPYSQLSDDEDLLAAIQELEADWERRTTIAAELLELRQREAQVCEKLWYVDCRGAAARIDRSIDACLNSDNRCEYEETWDDEKILDSVYLGYADLYEHAHLKGRRLRLRFSIDPDEPGMIAPGEWVDLKNLAFNDILSSLCTGSIGENWALDFRSWWLGTKFGGPSFNTLAILPNGCQRWFSKKSNFNDQATYVRLIPRQGTGVFE